ncbi:MAG: UDP-N-acetylmuramate--alanine ligase [Micavibrio sp.]|nr:UDP-N-acetylmuramate--alanine ligase [Micavibrio sp.]
MRTIPLDIGTLHFIGIGGIGMSGIAEVLHDLGYAVQGSDLSESGNVQRLRAKGISIAVGHDGKNLKTQDDDGPAVVVISSAVKADNPELIAAREQQLPVVRRAEMLAELMRLKWAVAIGGTHGKTTTTSMVGTMLEEGQFDPTVINGGIVNAYGTNTRLGQSDWMVVEADESDGTFTRLPATIVVVTNMDPEHMEHYGSFDNVREAYRQFVENIPFYGFAAMCLDHPEVQNLVATITDRRVITYGFNPQADVQAQNVTFKNNVATFDVVFAPWLNEGEALEIEQVSLPMLGLHNVQNSLAAITVGHAMGMPPATMKQALGKFTGVKRRFTRTGESNGVTVIDDYGHHPVEIAAVLKAGRMAVADTGGKIIAVFQPHRYSRLSSLFDDFCNSFNDAEVVIVADVYAAGEQPVKGADKKHLVEGIRHHGHRNVQALSGPDALPVMIAKMAEPGDYVICLGAGNITQWAYALPEQLDTLLPERQKAKV